MRAAGRPGRGERARVAERVRELLGDQPAARTPLDTRPSAATRSRPGLGWIPERDLSANDSSVGSRRDRGRDDRMDDDAMDDDAMDDVMHGRLDDAGDDAGDDFADDFADDGWGRPDQLPDRRRPTPRRERGAGPAAMLGDLRGRLRWDPGRKGAAALGVALVAVVAATGWWLAASKPAAVPVGMTSSVAAGTSAGTISDALTTTPADLSTNGSSAVPSTRESAAASTTAPVDAPLTGTAGTTAASSSSIVVDVDGRVRHPGIYTLPAGSRVADAIAAAGGARPRVDTVSINLAEPVQDGEQIVVGLPNRAATTLPGSSSPLTPSAGATVPAGGTESSAPAAPVDLNTASLEQLETLPGVGPVLGQNILDYRTAHGPFTSIDQLDDVTDIGPTRLAQLRPLVSV